MSDKTVGDTKVRSFKRKYSKFIPTDWVISRSTLEHFRTILWWPQETYVAQVRCINTIVQKVRFDFTCGRDTRLAPEKYYSVGSMYSRVYVKAA